MGFQELVWNRLLIRPVSASTSVIRSSYRLINVRLGAPNSTKLKSWMYDGLFFQKKKRFHGAEPLQNAFGVIDTIHPDA